MATHNIGNWAVVNDGGDTSGDSTLAVSCGNEYFGRTDRSGYANLTTDTSSNVATLNVVQQGATENVSISTVSNPSAAGGSVVVVGYTNSSKLTFALSSGASSFVTLPSTYTITYGASGSETSLTVNNGSAITGDPGATQRLSFSITLVLAENTAVSARSFTLSVTPNSGTAATQQITQPAGSDYICFDTVGGPTTKTITFNSKGYIGSDDSVDVTVKSNDDWSISTGVN